MRQLQNMRTSKQKVLERYPEAHCMDTGTRCGWIVYSTDIPAGVHVIQFGAGNSTPAKAWAVAWEKVKQDYI